MSEIADRYRRLAAGFTAKVVEVPDDKWDNPSPCEGWTARDVVGHVVSATESYLPQVDQEPPEHPPVSEDPIAAWARPRDVMQAALDDHHIARRQYEGLLGPTTLEASVATLLCTDLLVHAWDVAHACQLDEHLDPEDVHTVFETVKPMDRLLRTSGACGPSLPVPPGADEQTRLLAFLGRSV